MSQGQFISRFLEAQRAKGNNLGPLSETLEKLAVKEQTPASTAPTWMVTDEEIAALALEKDALYREMYGPHRRAIEGFEHFVAAARAQGVKLAVATSAPPKNIVFTLDELDLRRHFDTVVGAADVKHGKPHPDVFLKAAEQLDIAPAECIVFEDAPMGVEAARRAGMRAVVITTTLPAEAFAEFDNVIRVVDDYADLDLGSLCASLR